MTDFDRASQILADAFLHNHLIDPLPEAIAPQSFDAAYDVLDQTLERVGIPVAGWKLSVATRAAQQKLGLDGPLVGPLLAGRIVPANSTLSRDSINFPNIEAEIAIVMANTPPAGVDAATILPYVQSVHLAIEVADRRYEQKQDAIGTLADLNSTGYLVLGPQIANWQDMKFLGVAAETRANGVTLARNTDAGNWPDPFGGLAYLAAFLAGRGRALREGDVVTTGACATPTLCEHGQIEAIFEGVGQMEITITPATSPR